MQRRRQRRRHNPLLTRQTFVKTAHLAIQVLEDHEQVAELLENACITAARGIQAEVRSVIEETRQDVKSLAAGETESDRDE